MMRDRNGNEVRIGEMVKIVGKYDVPMHNYWIVKAFIDQGLVIETVLCHYHTQQILFIPLYDIERPFGD